MRGMDYGFMDQLRVKSRSAWRVAREGRVTPIGFL